VFLKYGAIRNDRLPHTYLLTIRICLYCAANTLPLINIICYRKWIYMLFLCTLYVYAELLAHMAMSKHFIGLVYWQKVYKTRVCACKHYPCIGFFTTFDINLQKLFIVIKNYQPEAQGKYTGKESLYIPSKTQENTDGFCRPIHTCFMSSL